MRAPWQPDAVETTERGRMAVAEVSWALRELNRASATVDHELARRLEMRGLEYAALNHVMTAGDEPLGPVELSARLGISTGSGTELVDRLERAGHLLRERHPHDRRRVVLRATDVAVSRLLAELGPLFTALDELDASLSPEERRAVERYLREAARRMTSYAAPPQH